MTKSLLFEAIYLKMYEHRLPFSVEELIEQHERRINKENIDAILVAKGFDVDLEEEKETLKALNLLNEELNPQQGIIMKP